MRPRAPGRIVRRAPGRGAGPATLPAYAMPALTPSMRARRLPRPLLPAVALAALLGAAHALRAQAATPAEAVLRRQTAELTRGVVKAAEGVWVAVGYGLANSILVEGDTGVVLVDAMESAAAATEVRAAFDSITRKPVVAVVYTHNHRDHIGGTRQLTGGRAVPVYAHALWPRLELAASPVRGAITARSLRQFGVGLPHGDRPNDGIGPELRLGMADLAPPVPPTVLVGDSLTVTLAGVRFRFVHAPSETADALYVVLPDRGVLLPGDAYYHAFPNLYAIRGTPYRDVREWAASLDRMVREGARTLVPSHTRPIVGAEEVRMRLSRYRDAIRHVYDATIAGINRGLDPDALAASVRLPDSLARQPYLQEVYGTVAWSVRAIFAGELGWFSGDAADLSPLPAAERARRMADLAGGTAALRDRGRAALAAGDAQWAAELAGHVLAIDPADVAARELKASAFEALARGQTSANGRNYYLMSARALRALSAPDQRPE